LDLDGKSRSLKNKDYGAAEEFAAAVEKLIAEARAKGVSVEALLIEIEDIASLPREELAVGQPPRYTERPGPPLDG
jgi:hypothetical protein